jgi:hypothetical protein
MIRDVAGNDRCQLSQIPEDMLSCDDSSSTDQVDRKRPSITDARLMPGRGGTKTGSWVILFYVEQRIGIGELRVAQASGI